MPVPKWRSWPGPLSVIPPWQGLRWASSSLEAVLQRWLEHPKGSRTDVSSVWSDVSALPTFSVIRCAGLIPSIRYADGSMICCHCIASIIFGYIFWLEICSIKSGMEILPLGLKDAWDWDMGFARIWLSFPTPSTPPRNKRAGNVYCLFQG